MELYFNFAGFQEVDGTCMTADDFEDGGVIELRLRLLDEAHARARTPKQRRRLEAKAREFQHELEDIRQKAKVVDLEYERWKRKLEEILGGDKS